VSSLSLFFCLSLSDFVNWLHTTFATLQTQPKPKHSSNCLSFERISALLSTYHVIDKTSEMSYEWKASIYEEMFHLIFVSRVENEMTALILDGLSFTWRSCKSGMQDPSKIRHATSKTFGKSRLCKTTCIQFVLRSLIAATISCDRKPIYRHVAETVPMTFIKKIWVRDELVGNNSR